MAWPWNSCAGHLSTAAAVAWWLWRRPLEVVAAQLLGLSSVLPQALVGSEVSWKTGIFSFLFCRQGMAENLLVYCRKRNFHIHDNFTYLTWGTFSHKSHPTQKIWNTTLNFCSWQKCPPKRTLIRNNLQNTSCCIPFGFYSGFPANWFSAWSNETDEMIYLLVFWSSVFVIPESFI